MPSTTILCRRALRGASATSQHHHSPPSGTFSSTAEVPRGQAPLAAGAGVCEHLDGPALPHSSITLPFRPPLSHSAPGKPKNLPPCSAGCVAGCTTCLPHPTHAQQQLMNAEYERMLERIEEKQDRPFTVNSELLVRASHTEWLRCTITEDRGPHYDGRRYVFVVRGRAGSFSADAEKLRWPEPRMDELAWWP